MDQPVFVTRTLMRLAASEFYKGLENRGLTFSERVSVTTPHPQGTFASQTKINKKLINNKSFCHRG